MTDYTTALKSLDALRSGLAGLDAALRDSMLTAAALTLARRIPTPTLDADIAQDIAQDIADATSRKLAADLLADLTRCRGE